MYLVLSATYPWDLYGISIAFVVHSLDHSLWDLLSPSLSTQLIVRLIPAGAVRGWCAVRTP